MKNSLYALCASALILLNPGCSTTISPVFSKKQQKSTIVTNSLPEINRGPYTTDWNIKSNALTQVSSTNEAFNLESIVSDKRRFYVTPNTEKSKDELDFLLFDVASTTLTINDTDKKIGYETETFFVPNKIKKSDGTDKKIVALKVDGPHAVKAKRGDITFGTNLTDYAITKISNKDIPYLIKTFNIAGKDYYAPFLDTNQGNLTNNEPNFVLIPVYGTTRKINPDGRIDLESNAGIYALKTLHSSEYNQRNKDRLASENRIKMLELQRLSTNRTTYLPRGNVDEIK
ncbi:MAG: hypothetical protein AABW65_03500 [Nanoarchaeota archaeon]